MQPQCKQDVLQGNHQQKEQWERDPLAIHRTKGATLKLKKLWLQRYNP
ncbi:MAG: hypothetical protein HFP77_01540 [Methylococcales symbiont of Iophon sp. n. MRB-2018]|nr:MAG: hypothetical protein HFP77_01540 [Methylococcales symbiont of Iophon sp. n. MRB-2018]